MPALHEHVLDNPLTRRSNVARKGLSFALHAARPALRPLASAPGPTVVVNSIPKSGTHLALQLARALPNTVYLSGFLAQTPSLTLRHRSTDEVLRRLDTLLPGEVIGAHLHHDPAVEDRLSDPGRFLALMVIRDPREVLVSEADYLANAAPFHRAHRAFKRADDLRGRIGLALDGVPGIAFPDLRARIEPYVRWMDAAGVVTVRYEDLVGEGRPEALTRIARAHLDRLPATDDAPAGATTPSVDQVVAAMAAAIDPANSHTFRRGGTDKWRTELTAAEIDRADELIGDLIERMGYER